jgi:hypothetical protein
MHSSRSDHNTTGGQSTGLFPLPDTPRSPAAPEQVIPPQRMTPTRRGGRPRRPVLQPTDEQRAVIDKLHEGDNILVEARAGTGKTTTLVMGSTELHYLRILYLAYNTSTALDAQKKFRPHVRCRTLHSLAAKSTPEWAQDRLSGSRQNGHMVADILRINEPIVISKGFYDMPVEARLRPHHVARVTMETIRRFCYSADEDIDWWHVPQQQGFTPEAQWQLARTILPHAHRAWRDLLDPHGRLRYEHDFYLKIWCLDDPQLPYDVIMLDEAQDSNALACRLITHQTGRQTVVIGDPHQQLYKWRGSIDALTHFPDHTLLHLTRSRRFGQAIADAANIFLTLLNASPLVRGNPELPSHLVEHMPDPDAILCRTNGGAMEEVLNLLAADRPVILQGGSDPIERMAEACLELQAGAGTEHPELCAFRTWREVEEYAEHDPGGQDLKAFIRLINLHGAPNVIAACQQLTSTSHRAPTGPTPVVVSTIHKAKGLEWNTVRIGADAITPRYDGATGELIPPDRAEWMLAYVACTRAARDLDPGPLREWWQHRPTAP